MVKREPEFRKKKTHDCCVSNCAFRNLVFSDLLPERAILKWNGENIKLLFIKDNTVAAQ